MNKWRMDANRHFFYPLNQLGNGDTRLLMLYQILQSTPQNDYGPQGYTRTTLWPKQYSCSLDIANEQNSGIETVLSNQRYH